MLPGAPSPQHFPFRQHLNLLVDNRGLAVQQTDQDIEGRLFFFALALRRKCHPSKSLFVCTGRLYTDHAAGGHSVSQSVSQSKSTWLGLWIENRLTDHRFSNRWSVTIVYNRWSKVADHAPPHPQRRASNATVLCYQHHGCLSGSHTCTHARSAESRNICHLGRGRSSFPAQSQLHMELIAYLPTHRIHECRCKGPLCADGIGNSVEVWCCCVTGGRDEGVVLYIFIMEYRTNSTYKTKVIKKNYSVHNCSITMSMSALSKCKRTECPNLTCSNWAEDFQPEWRSWVT